LKHVVTKGPPGWGGEIQRENLGAQGFPGSTGFTPSTSTTASPEKPEAASAAPAASGAAGEAPKGNLFALWHNKEEGEKPVMPKSPKTAVI